MSRIIHLLLLISLLYPVSASAQEGEWPEAVKTPRAEATRVAVADWCDARGGELIINEGHPLCLAFDSAAGIQVLFKGEWRIELAFASQYWWQMRTMFSDEPTLGAGVLWLVDFSAHPPVEYDERMRAQFRELTGSELKPSPEIHRAVECMYADAALSNPANVRVYLIGLTVNDCEEAVAQ